MLKPIVWLGDSLPRLREFAPEARHEAGVELGLVQAGEDPTDWKPMPSVGLGVNEKSRKTARSDLELARARFRSLVRDRRQR
jgi:phage-related protein